MLFRVIKTSWPACLQVFVIALLGFQLELHASEYTVLVDDTKITVDLS